jgi:hypothetical protein
MLCVVNCEKETWLVSQGWAFSISLAAALHGESPEDRSGDQKAGSTSFPLRETALPCAAYRNLGHKFQKIFLPGYPSSRQIGSVVV